MVNTNGHDSVIMEQPHPSRILPVFSDVLHTTVVPLQNTAHAETIDPTLLDSFYLDYFSPYLFAYRLAEKSDAVYSQTVKRIKESLSKVLIPFFSFAGRWVAASPGSARRKLLCNDEGVPFIEAYMDADLDSIVKASTAFQPVPELQGHQFLGMDATQYQQQLPPNGLPAIFAQVTRFKCGGLVLAVTFNHMHVDAHGFFYFMKAWSDFSRTNQTTVKVDHTREQLDVPCLRALFLDPSIHEADSPAAKLGPWAMKSFEVGASTIKALKEEAKSNPEGRGWVGTGDCIMAQFLKTFQVLEEQEVQVIQTVEGRTRFFDPPIPAVMGNVISVLLQPQIPGGEILEMPLVSIANRFREQLEKTKKEDWLGGVELLVEILISKGKTKRKYFVATSVFKFPIMYEIDFGFGNPYFVAGPNSCASNPFVGKVVILPPIPSSSSSVATVNIYSTPDVFQALESDPQFVQFFGTH